VHRYAGAKRIDTLRCKSMDVDHAGKKFVECVQRVELQDMEGLKSRHRPLLLPSRNASRYHVECRHRADYAVHVYLCRHHRRTVW
jgi:hypothetical protein